MTCKTVTVCGRRRKLCWGKSGFTSNKPAGGGGGRKKGRAKGKCPPCVASSGPKRGKLKKGWRFGKNGRCVKAKG